MTDCVFSSLCVLGDINQLGYSGKRQEETGRLDNLGSRCFGHRDGNLGILYYDMIERSYGYMEMG